MIQSDLHGDMQSVAEMTTPGASKAQRVTNMNGPKVSFDAPVNRKIDSASGYMLEHPSIRRYSLTLVGSDNPIGADNQQET